MYNKIGDIMEKIQKLINKYNSIALFWDMDGVLAEFDILDKEKLHNNEKGLFLNKRPVFTVIGKAKEIFKSPNIDSYILSICYYNEQKQEKIDWLDKYLPMIREDKRIILIKEKIRDEKKSEEIKVKFLNTMISENKYEHIIIVDDTHAVLNAVKKEFGDKITALHISSIIS